MTDSRSEEAVASHIAAPSSTVQQTETAPGNPVPFSYAKRHGVLFDGHATKEAQWLVNCRADSKLHPLLELRRHLRHSLSFEVLEDGPFDLALQRAFEQGSSQAIQNMEELDDALDLNQVIQEIGEPKDLADSDDDAPIIRLINALLTEAVTAGASDIHIEPYEDRLVARFRVDGVMRKVLDARRALAPLLVSRVKVMSRLDIAEKRLPQDGRISIRIAGRPVDVRVSTLPTGHGERVVMRLLDKQAGRLDLEQLGLPARLKDRTRRLIHKPNGILLVTGPTGSGKTTTLYAILRELNDHTRNIMTVEDPIEYHLEGVSQTHVNTKVGLTFAQGLRSILRQDPDVVMVGEIRDLETAQIAVQSSLTGHLVLSTLHTNSAVGAITRLRDTGVESYLLASSLLGVMAQRLVRILCETCKRPLSWEELEQRYLQSGLLEEAVKGTDWQGLSHDALRQRLNGLCTKGTIPCSDCANGRFQGRQGIYELLLVDGDTRAQIHADAGELALQQAARRVFPSSLREEALGVAAQGRTTLEEVLRITRED
jgi:general secretion pathway protein E